MNVLSRAFAAALLVLTVRSASAQVSVPSLLSTQFSGPEREAGTGLTLLQPFRDAPPRPGITQGFENELTVHTAERARGVLEDLHASGRFLSGFVPLGRSPRAPQVTFRYTSLVQGGVMNEGTRLSLHGYAREPQVRLLFPGTNLGAFYVGYSRMSYTADGNTNLYKGLFTIFPQTPPFHLETRSETVSTGGVYRIAPDWTAEASLGWTRSPGEITLSESDLPTRLTVPLGDQGPAVAGSVRRRLSDRAALVLFASSAHATGDAAVTRESGRQIGAGTSTSRETEHGIGWERRLSASRRAELHYESSYQRWDTNGFVPDPRDLETNIPLVSDLNYHTGYRFAKQMWGGSWQQDYRAQHRLRIGYDYAILKVHLQADYTARLVLFSQGSQSSHDENGLRGHLLQIRYGFPIAHLQNELSLSQVIPASIRSSSGGGGSSANGTARTTYGGWALGWSLTRPF